MSNTSPLSWTDDDRADVGSHLSNARNVAGTLIAIDGSHLGDLEALPPGAVCTLMIMLARELRAVTEILEQGGGL